MRVMIVVFKIGNRPREVETRVLSDSLAQCLDIRYLDPVGLDILENLKLEFTFIVRSCFNLNAVSKQGEHTIPISFK